MRQKHQEVSSKYADHVVRAIDVNPALQTKALGDPADDLVYTPVAPSRIVDTRLAGGSNRFLWNARLQSVDERRRIRVARRRSWFTPPNIRLL